MFERLLFMDPFLANLRIYTPDKTTGNLWFGQKWFNVVSL